MAFPPHWKKCINPPLFQSYTAVNVKAINRHTENLAQYINIKEEKRLAKKLTCIDREKTVLRNAITRDEKVGEMLPQIVPLPQIAPYR